MTGCDGSVVKPAVCEELTTDSSGTKLCSLSTPETCPACAFGLPLSLLLVLCLLSTPETCCPSCAFDERTVFDASDSGVTCKSFDCGKDRLNWAVTFIFSAGGCMPRSLGVGDTLDSLEANGSLLDPSGGNDTHNSSGTGEGLFISLQATSDFSSGGGSMFDSSDEVGGMLDSSDGGGGMLDPSCGGGGMLDSSRAELGTPSGRSGILSSSCGGRSTLDSPGRGGTFESSGGEWGLLESLPRDGSTPGWSGQIKPDCCGGGTAQPFSDRGEGIFGSSELERGVHDSSARGGGMLGSSGGGEHMLESSREAMFDFLHGG